MTKEIGVVGAYTRGVSSIVHGVRELQVSIVRQVVISAVLCGLFAAWGIRSELSAQARALTGSYIKASIMADLGWSRPVTVTGEGKTVWTAPAPVAVVRLRRLFGGRPVTFVGWQWLLRTLISAAVMMPLIIAMMVVLGRRVLGDKHRRGAKVIDRTAPEQNRPAWLWPTGAMTLGSVLGGVVGAAYAVAPKGLLALPHICVAWLAMHVSALAAFLSPGGTGVIWTPAPVAELLAPSASYAAGLGQLGAAGQLGLLMGGSLGALVGGCTVALVCQDLQRRAAAAADPLILRLAGVEIPRKREVNHFTFCGATGAGKSVAICQVLDKVRERLQRAIVYDTSGEFVAKYFRAGIDIILSCSDARAAAWTPWADIRYPGDALAMGESLFARSSGKDEFWTLAGSSVFAGLLEKLGAWGDKCNTYLAFMAQRLGVKDLMTVLKGTVGERFVDDGAEETATSVVMTAAGHLRSFGYLRDPKPGEKAFSIKEFVEDTTSDRWMFVVMRDEDAAVMKPLVSLWLDIAMSAVLSLPGEAEQNAATHQKENNGTLKTRALSLLKQLVGLRPFAVHTVKISASEQRRLFLSLDELQSLQKLPSLDGALLRGRKKGLAVVLGIQSIKGVRAIYGNNEADALMGQPQTQLVLRTPEEGTARWCEGQLGKAEVERVAESEQIGASSKQQGGVSLSRSVAQEAVVLASEIQDLPDLEGYLKTIGKPVMRVRYEVPKNFKPHCAGFVQAPKVGEPVAPPTWKAMEAERLASRLASKGDTEGARRELSRATELAGGREPELQERIAQLRAKLASRTAIPDLEEPAGPGHRRGPAR